MMEATSPAFLLLILLAATFGVAWVGGQDYQRAAQLAKEKEMENDETTDPGTDVVLGMHGRNTQPRRSQPHGPRPLTDEDRKAYDRMLDQIMDVLGDAFRYPEFVPVSVAFGEIQQSIDDYLDQVM